MSSRNHNKLNLTLTPSISSAIDRYIANGSFPSKAAFIEQAIREKLHRAAQYRLDQLLFEGLNSGPPIPFDDAFKTDFLKELAARSKAKRGSKKSRDQLLLDALEDSTHNELSPQLRKKFIAKLRTQTRTKSSTKSRTSRPKSS